MTRRTVVHVIASLDFGGAQRSLVQFVQSTISDFEHHVVTALPPGPLGRRLDHVGVRVISMHLRSRAAALGSIAALGRIIWNIKPDIIQGWMYHGNVLVSMMPGKAAKVWNIRHCLEAVETETHLTKKLIYIGRFLSSYPSSIIYNSETSRVLHEAAGYNPKRGIVIPNGFNVQPISVRERQTIRASLGIADSEVAIGVLARVHPVKGHRYFAEAMSVVPDDKVRLVFCGPGTDAKLFSDLLGRTGNSDRSICLGPVENPEKILSALDLLCSPSLSESFPNAVGEAMALGVPCIATAVGATPELIGECGILVRARDVGALSNAVKRFLRMPKEEREKLSTACRRHIELNFSTSATMEKYKNLYNSLSNLGPS